MSDIKDKEAVVDYLKQLKFLPIYIFLLIAIFVKYGLLGIIILKSFQAIFVVVSKTFIISNNEKWLKRYGAA